MSPKERQTWLARLRELTAENQAAIEAARNGGTTEWERAVAAARAVRRHLQSYRDAGSPGLESSMDGD